MTKLKLFLQVMNWAFGNHALSPLFLPYRKNWTSLPTLHSYSTKVSVDFISADGKTSKTVTGNVGEHLLHLAHENDIDLEGACEGSLACSTCHVILDLENYNKLNEPSDEENDMLDLAFGLTQTSRLGCQVKLVPELEGMKIRLPSATRNIAVDKLKPSAKKS